MNQDKLYLLWANGDPVTAEHMVMMYAINSKLHGWWEDVTVIIWGAAAAALIESPALRLKMEVAKEAGVHFSACISCANNLGVTKELEELGVEVIRWGEKLTKLMKGGGHVLSV
ncbi:MAG: hypothetical protein ACOYJU_02320 [Anaerovoracaceae bacterium]|jgi:hypothetical protein